MLKLLGEYSLKPPFIAHCDDGTMRMTTVELYRLAGDLADEHGAAASDFASRAVMTLEAEGAHERAQFWFLMLILLGDINSGRVDPDALITLH
jgi:hypothetical protein